MITNYCLIRENRISCNGNEIFRSEKATSVETLFEQAYQSLKIDYPKFYKMDNLSKAGFLAAEILFSKIDKSVSRANVSVVLSNASASLDTDMRYATASRLMPSPALFVYTLPNIVTGEICIRHKIKGENAFFVAPEFDADLLVSYCSMLPQASLYLAGWVEVMGNHHDVFLYLLDNSNAGIPHTAANLKELYINSYGTVNG